MRAAATVYEAILGLALLFAPWTALWSENWFFWAAAPLRGWIFATPARGMVSGFGAAFLLLAAERWILPGRATGEEGPRG